MTNILPQYWKIPKEFFMNENLSKIILGTNGVILFNKLSDSKKNIALDIIASSASMNDPNTFAEIGINQNYYLPQPPISQSETKEVPPLKQGVLKNMILNKYQLKGTSSTELEKGLRKAAANGEPKDIHFLVTNWKSLNVNAQAPDSKKTALHWASGAKKNSALCFEILVQHGASWELIDSKGKKALDYATGEVWDFLAKIVVE